MLSASVSTEVRDGLQNTSESLPKGIFRNWTKKILPKSEMFCFNFFSPKLCMIQALILRNPKIGISFNILISLHIQWNTRTFRTLCAFTQVGSPAYHLLLHYSLKGKNKSNASVDLCLRVDLFILLMKAITNWRVGLADTRMMKKNLRRYFS